MVHCELEQEKKIREDINMSQFLLCKTQEDLSGYGKKIIDTTNNRELFLCVINQYIPKEKLENIWVINNIHEMVDRLQEYICVIEEIVLRSEVLIFWYGSDFRELEVVNSREKLMLYLKNEITNPCVEIDLYADFRD